MLVRSLNGQHENLKGALQVVAVNYTNFFPFENSSPCTSHVPGDVTMETGNGFDDHRGGSFLKYGICGPAIRLVSHVGGLALMLSFPFDNVHRKFQRLVTQNGCHREEKDLTGNQQQTVITSVHKITK